MASVDELIPCARCGARGEGMVVIDAREEVPHGWEVFCHGCGRVGAFSCLSMDDAGDRWNRAQENSDGTDNC